MDTTTCPLCCKPVAAWWKTTLHPGCPLYRVWEFERDPWNAPFWPPSVSGGMQ